MTVNRLMLPVLMTMGAPKKDMTGSSMSEWRLMKFRLSSFKVLESLTQDPGLGEGTCKKEIK